jgi:uncharacterized membrane protein YoaK (UPF0700 family)
MPARTESVGPAGNVPCIELSRSTFHATVFREHRPKLLVALLLTFASGLVDIVGYLGIFHFFTAHLTGTTVQLGRAFASHNWVDVIAAAAIALAFFSGSIFGRAVIEVGSRRRIRSIASVTLAIEALLLALVALAPRGFSAAPYMGLAVLAAAMGLQTATLTGIGPLTVHTTFVTGMINKLAQLVSHIAFRACDLRRSKARAPHARLRQSRDIQMALLLVAVWLFYVVGAVAGTLSFESWGLQSLSIAVGILAIGIVTDRFWPLSIKEEKEQSER